MQCKALMVQGRLGFATLAQKMDGGHYLVFSLPTNTRADYRHASLLVKSILSQAFWGNVEAVRKFSAEDVERVTASTTHIWRCTADGIISF